MSFFNNVIWSLSGTIGVRIIGLLTSILLARLLTPEIFGIVGMAMVIVGFIYVVQEAGLSSVLIQRKSINKTLVVTTFYMNIIFSLLLIVLLIILAPFIADFYKQSAVKTLLYFSSIGIFIGALGITERGLLTRDKKFKKLTSIDLVAEVTTSLFSIILALLGYWMLAVGLSILFRPAIQSLSLFLVAGFNNVKGKPDFKLAKDILPYSLNVQGTRIINFARNNVDYLIIGKILGSSSLGIYTIAFQWSTVARFYFSQAIANVAFPEIARNQNDFNKVGIIYTNIIRKISFITFPLCMGIACVADEFIMVLYGDRWLEVIPVLQVLMLAGMITSIGTVVGSVYKGIGRPDIELKVNVYSLISFIILILILGNAYGLIGVAYAVLINTIIFNIVMTTTLFKIINLKFNVFIKSLKNAFYSTILMSVLLYLIKPMISNEFNFTLTLIILVLLGFMFYLFATYIFNKQMLYWVIDKAASFKRKKQFRGVNDEIYKSR
ncbi:lipopolysaccharide biosynthesis protein [Bacillus sp. NEB1478]|uniref:lipopolysaccharide biosynthesis protein n=1 Tax=Bacillus sp. NEB1478 TaxID=3073816 RepID=UPI002872CE19|nr:lipopolysaccharide biosynthesis protein [Bacillus sp. NEB1478]WNB92683.1 lipopolysaccharide biosynthesis protein [Bacillus sp. NEB1478]